MLSNSSTSIVKWPYQIYEEEIICYSKSTVNAGNRRNDVSDDFYKWGACKVQGYQLHNLVIAPHSPLSNNQATKENHNLNSESFSNLDRCNSRNDQETFTFPMYSPGRRRENEVLILHLKASSCQSCHLH